jgi:hypothetical protein
MLGTTTSTPHLVNRKTKFQNTQNGRFVGSTGVKRSYSLAHKSMEKAIKKGVNCWRSPLIMSMPQAWCCRKNE